MSHQKAHTRHSKYGKPLRAGRGVKEIVVSKGESLSKVYSDMTSRPFQGFELKPVKLGKEYSLRIHGRRYRVRFD